MVDASLFFTMFLMFVGGASGSTAGGIKVNTFGLLVSAVVSSLRGREKAVAFGREFSDENTYRALTLAFVYLASVAVVVLALSATEKIGFVSLLFDTFSAFGTTGLSTGITPDLSVAGRLIITASMFAGRLGPLALVSAMTRAARPAAFRYPKDVVRIG